MDYSKIPADTKNWTVVLQDGCAECGFEPGFDYADIAHRLRSLEAPVMTAFNRPEEELYQRPNERTWAPIEYLLHCAEVCEIMMNRLNLMLVQDNPEFENWDQDVAAEAGDYLTRSVGSVKRDLLANLQHAATEFEKVPADLLGRTGHRGDGAQFTVRSLAEYFIHDLEHHIYRDLPSY